MKIDRIDHVVVNCRDVDAMAAWYERVLGFEREVFGPEGRTAMKFGRQKLNLRPTDAPNWETGAVDPPGTMDFCFVTEDSVADIVAHLKACGVTITRGPSVRTGAMGPINSVYCRDPDGNLVEISSY